jgi:pSer/pThr/pTyr-binding forkhead associated (FHA) protein
MELLIIAAAVIGLLSLGALIRAQSKAEARRKSGLKPASPRGDPRRPKRKEPQVPPPPDRAPVAVASPARLTTRTGSGQQTVEVPVSPFTIGRRRENLLVLADEHVSRVHAKLMFEGGQWYIADAGSSNGIFVNGRRVSVERLRPGDEIDIGPYVLCFDSTAGVRSEQRVDGPFELLETIGRGGMAVVYRARLTSSGQVVAAKIPMAGDEEVIRRFLQEAEITLGMQHQNIVQVYSHGQLRDGRPYILMEYLMGGSLRARMAPGRPLPEPIVRNVGAQVASALGCAHQHRVVHRDIKPENVLFDQRDVVRVADFGIAASQVHARMTQSGMMIGTCHYMSPEQIDGRTVTAASDLYSLGCMLYEMSTGSCPFEGASQAVMYSHLNREPTPLEQVNPSLSPQLSATIHGLLRKSPSERPTGAEEVSRALAPAVC